MQIQAQKGRAGGLRSHAKRPRRDSLIVEPRCLPKIRDQMRACERNPVAKDEIAGQHPIRCFAVERLALHISNSVVRHNQGSFTERTVSCRISPVGVSHVMDSPIRTPIKAAPTGVRTDNLLFEMSASCG